jgi:hypothetical protein
VLTIGAATLAVSKSSNLVLPPDSPLNSDELSYLQDIYPPKERGRIMGLYYAAPLLGPSLGPLVGGIVTKVFSWRATFYFLAIFGGVSLVTFVFFRDTFRRERSLAYQAALRKAKLETELTAAIASTPVHESDARHRKEKTAVGAVSHRISQSAERKFFRYELESQSRRASVDTNGQSSEPKVGLRHMQTFQPMTLVIRRPNNLCVLGASGLSKYLLYA